MIVASHLRDIALELDRAGPPASEPPASLSSTSFSPASLSTLRAAPPPLLDIAAAERLASGSLMFPAADGDAWLIEPAWHVFSHRRLEPGSGGVLLFAQAGVIGGGLGDDAFVELAYHIVLQRQADPDGHRAYRETLQSGHQTRHGVLRDLAGSAEAGENGRLLVILPGNWLALDLAADADAEAALPDAVRIDLRDLPATPDETGVTSVEQAG